MPTDAGTTGTNGTTTSTPAKKTTAAAPAAPAPSFIVELLKAIGAPATANNIAFMNAWFRREGTSAAYNPMATTEKMPGSYDLPGNPAHVQQYTSLAEGVQATAKTLENGRYGDVLGALRAGTANVNATYAGLHTWSGGGYSSLAGVSTAAYGVGGTLTGAKGSGGGPAPDKLDMAALTADYGWTANFLNSVPELRSLLQEALNSPSQWTPQKFAAEVMNTQWFQRNSSTARKYLALEKTDPAEYRQQLARAEADVRDQAGQMGATPSAAAIQEIATHSLFFGLDQQQMAAALSYYIGPNKQGNYEGQAAAVAQQLRQTAFNNGLTMSNSFLEGAARYVASGQNTVDTYDALLRQQAASAFPTFAKQIMAGENMSDLASAYTGMKAQLLEQDPSTVNLFDPQVRKWLTARDAKGQPTTTPLWQAENEVRSDPRWLGTNNARDSLMSTTHNLLQAWGVSI